MPYHRLIPLALAAALACAPSAHAQDSACNTLTDAAVKQILTPHHATMTTTLNGKATKSEIISTATTRYLFVNGKWTSHPVDVKKEADETAAAMKARSQTCKRLGEETLAGQAATTYAVHSNDADSDSKVWIASAGGLILGQDITADGGSVTSIRYDYANVQPPKM